jgi:hypothetical protein
MKRLVRSIIDPSPRNLSVKSLTVVVGMLLCGIGISVHEYLQSGGPGVRAASSSLVEPGACKREARRSGSGVVAPRERSPEATPSVEGLSPSVDRPTTSARGTAPTQWIPDSEPSGNLGEETRADVRTEPGAGRAGSVSSQ